MTYTEVSHIINRMFFRLNKGVRHLSQAAALSVAALFTVACGLSTQALCAQSDLGKPGAAQPASASGGDLVVCACRASSLTAEASSVRPDLPDAPEPLRAAGTGASSSALIPDSPRRTAGTPATTPAQPKGVAPFYHRYIEPGEIAQHLSPAQQVAFGFAQSISPYFLLTVGAAAGYEQATNGAPNYGSNITAFGQRLGAAAVRNTSQSVLSDSVMAPLLHEDPRYYVMGVRRKAFLRATYAASRVFVTRDADDGHLTPNYAEVSGYAEAALLTDAYYPAVNRHVGRTLGSFGVSLGGAAISNVIREFYPSLRSILRREALE